MKDKDKDRSVAKALKRAAADMRCAVRKLGLAEAYSVLSEMSEDAGYELPVVILPGKGGAS